MTIERAQLIGNLQLNSGLFTAQESKANFDFSEETPLVELTSSYSTMSMTLAEIKKLKSLLCDCEKRLELRHEELIKRKNFNLNF